jgi:hypothetical protein
VRLRAFAVELAERCLENELLAREPRFEDTPDFGRIVVVRLRGILLADASKS